MAEIASRYDPSKVEEKWYAHWEAQGYFESKPDEREAYSIVIPPPNVTGVLHMGHMLNNTVQDILARKARLDGKNVCWVPGTDHASIATEAKVVGMLREKGIRKSDISRTEFIQHAWEWTDKYGGIILKQLKKLGASCDWKRTAFTMDESRSDAVIKAFVDLYNEGKLYRDFRMVNWDPVSRTVLSNEEVLYDDETTKLCYVKYKVVSDKDEYVTIATTRPETILGDSGVAVHPDDERYQHLRDKKVIIPVVNRAVPIIFDDYVDREFGTGALKITPAHDANDYEIGKRHGLEVIDVLNDDGSINEQGADYQGLSREDARKRILEEIQDLGQIDRIEDYTHSVGRSERTNAIVEPKLSLQWYVDMKSLAKPALEAVLSDDIEFFPKRQKNTYRHWMENIRDWCISRQLWWGHRIPAYYYQDEIFVAENAELALSQAQARFSPMIDIGDLRQDEDVLDTWFSSWLWPITCFKGFEDERELSYYYPTSVLVTGWDIIFLWVARMIMSGFEWRDTKPFNHVYFTGMVRDRQRRKMSKSLGNSPDALELIDRFGADGVRFGVLSSSPAGGDLLFEEKLCEQGRNFCNKIWNALRLVKSWDVYDGVQPPDAELACSWIKGRLAVLSAEIEEDFKKYRLSDMTMKLYQFIWNDFCSWYLEMIKPEFGQPIDRVTLESCLDVFEKTMTCLHPVMPFISEEIWHHLKERTMGEDCMISFYPASSAYDKGLLERVEGLKSVVGKVRELRNDKNIKPKEALSLYVEASEGMLMEDDSVAALTKKMAFLSNIRTGVSFPDEGTSFMASNEKYFLEFFQEVNLEEEKARITKDLEYAQGFLNSVKKKLSNERFVNNAPAAVVEKEQQKLKDGEERVRILRETLEGL